MPAQSNSNLGPIARATKTLVGISRTPARVSEVFEELSHWERMWRPGPTAWNCTEIVGHLLDAEIAFAFRVRTALGQPGKVLDAYDQDAWVHSQGSAAVQVEEVLSTFAALRRNLTLLVARLSEVELARHYMHSLRGHQSIGETLVFIHSHDERHLVQLGRTSELARQARPLV